MELINACSLLSQSHLFNDKITPIRQKNNVHFSQIGARKNIVYVKVSGFVELSDDDDE